MDEQLCWTGCSPACRLNLHTSVQETCCVWNQSSAVPSTARVCANLGDTRPAGMLAGSSHSGQMVGECRCGYQVILRALDSV